MQKYLVHIKGFRPLLHNRYPMEDLTDVKKKAKTVFVPEDDAKKSLYYHQGKIMQPSSHIEGALIKGATSITWQKRKSFKDLVANNVFVETDFIPFEKPKDPEKYEVDIQMCVNKMAGRIPKARPRWDDWEFKFTLLNNADDHITKGTMEEIIKAAGLVGIGTYRLKYGKFELVSLKEIK